MPTLFNPQDEKTFINRVYNSYRVGDDAPQTQAMRELIFSTFKPYLKGGVGLELGCSDGYMTAMLASRLERLDVVDACDNFIEEAKSRGLANVNFHTALFEEYQAKEQYDYVFASYILEHVFEVAPVLAMAKRVLKPGGRFFAVVPNARALSRQLALHMGLLENLYNLTENDHNHGHRRVYDRVHFTRDMEQAGFSVIHQGGIMLKILADFQMDELIGTGFLKDAHLQGLYKLGLEYPDLAGSLFVICEPSA